MINTMSATKMAESVKSKQISSEELLKAHYAHIQKVNPQINAIIQFADQEECLKQARFADEQVSKKGPLGKLHGVPITIKDCIKVKGLAASLGCKMPQLVKSEQDSTIAARLRAEGAIILGFTNVPEMLICTETDNIIYGQTKNPYNLARTPGGSSGGCAAILAAAGSAFSIGSDAAGSIRWPAHCTGIAGLKPTHGLIPRTGGALGDAPGIFGPISTSGPMARYVEDLELGLSIIAGPDERDPLALPLQLLENNPKSLNQLKVAFFTDDGFATPSQDIQNAVRQAAHALKGDVASLEENRPHCLGWAFKLIWETVFLSGDRGQGVKGWVNFLGLKETSPLLKELISQAETHEFSIADLRMRLSEMDVFRIEMKAFMQNYDILLSPVAATTAKSHGRAHKEIRDLSYVMAHNITGWPVAVVRIGSSDEGLPIGIQIVGKPWQDKLVLNVAKHLESIFGGWQAPQM